MESASPAYKRIVLKLSGEALRETGGRDTISPQIVKEIARQVKEVSELGVQISIVIGGGNIWRGLRRVIAAWIARPPITWACSRP